MKKPACIALAVTLAASKAGAASVGALSFMSGCWTTAPGVAEVMRECFTAPHAGLMQSSSQTVNGGETTFWEFAMIEQAGALAVVALVQDIGRGDTFEVAFERRMSTSYNSFTASLDPAR